MLDGEQGAESATPEKRPMDRSPSFPYIGLTKAIERVEGLYAFAKRHDARIMEAAKPAWNLGAKSSGTLQTVAALLSYGLIEASGIGEARKIKLSDLGYRAIADPRPGAKEQALATAALKPKLIAEFWETWGLDRPSAPIAEGTLHFDRGFTADGAKTFLKVYDDCVRYAAPSDSDRGSDNRDAVDGEEAPPNPSIVVGDLVRIEVGGQIIVEKAPVRAIQEHEGQSWVFVEGTETGALMSDTILLQKGAVASPSVTPPTLPLTPKSDETPKGARKAVFPISDGDVVLTFPEGISGKGLKRLKRYLDIFLDEEIEHAEGE
jgi:hypothetical protein